MGGFIYEEDDLGQDFLDCQFALGEEADKWVRSKAVRIKNLEAEIAGIGSVAYPLMERMDALKEKLVKEEESLLKLMASAGIRKIEDGRFVAKLSTTEYVDCPEVSKLPDEFVRKTILQSPDLMAIKREIKRGVVIDGCSIKKRDFLTIK